jgi:hypothetical protein
MCLNPSNKLRGSHPKFKCRLVLNHIYFVKYNFLRFISYHDYVHQSVGVSFGTYSYQLFGGARCLYFHLVLVYQIIRRHIPKKYNVGTPCMAQISVAELQIRVPAVLDSIHVLDTDYPNRDFRNFTQ